MILHCAISAQFPEALPDHVLNVLQFYNEKAVGLILPDSIKLKVVETEGVVKGQTAASSYKPATLERGIKTTVPQFISTNDEIVVSTYDGSYIEKAKN